MYNKQRYSSTVVKFPSQSVSGTPPSALLPAAIAWRYSPSPGTASSGVGPPSLLYHTGAAPGPARPERKVWCTAASVFQLHEWVS